MPVLGLDHVNLRTADVDSTISFFRDVLRMSVRPPPGAAPGQAGAWVYDSNDLAVVHIGRAEASYPTDGKFPFRPSHGGGAVHHLALSCAGFQETKAQLEALQLDYSESYVPQVSLRQIFVSEPNGVLLELNFPGE